MITHIPVSFVIATFVSAVLMRPLVRLAESLHAVDVPGGHKTHNVPVPRIGGVAMVIGAVLPMIMWAPMTAQMVAFLCGVAVILIFGVVDDLKGLDYRIKFFGQIVAVLVVVWYGDVLIRFLPFSGSQPLPDYVAIPVTVLALVGITNAVNLADGLDGLAGGIVLLSLGAVAILAYPSNERSLPLVTAAVMGSIVGFLRFNTYPARVFMGDGGSQFLGFSAGVVVVILTQQTNTAYSAALPLMILGLPLLDTGLVMAERIYEGRSPFVADKNHMHHKLLRLGMHHYEAVFVIYLLQSLLVTAAYFLRYEADWLIVCLYGAFCAGTVVGLKAAAASGWRIHARPHAGATPFVPPWIQWLRKDQRFLKGAVYFATLAIVSYVTAGALLVQRVPRDVGVLALSMLVLLAMLYIKRRGAPFNIIERACAYTVAASIVYLGQDIPDVFPGFTRYRNLLFAAMTVAVVIGFRFSQERFRITPMDFLVLLVALVVPSMPDLGAGLGTSGVAIAMMIVLFYTIELVLNNIWRRWDVMRFATCVALAVLGIRGVAAPFWQLFD